MSFGINIIWKCCGKKECDFKALLPKLCQNSCGIITGIKTTKKGMAKGFFLVVNNLVSVQAISHSTNQAELSVVKL
jgi:hypothetical protein